MPKKQIDIDRATQLKLIRLRAEAELELQERLCTSYKGFVKEISPSFIFYPHCNILNDAFNKVVAGEMKRLMIFMPPRHSKSESTSRLLPAYDLYRNPLHHIGLCSYSADLAFSMSRDARENYTKTGKKISEDASATVEWHTEDGGRFWSAGIGGPITGKGFHLGIIDDYFKNFEEAYSSAHREKVWNWYQSTFYTRKEPGASIVIMATRWHEDDLAGRLLEAEKDSPENWHIINFSAIKEKNPPIFPSTCTIEPDWRIAEGEALCPERYDAHELKKIENGVGRRVWISLYQQRPTAETGDIWKREWFYTTHFGVPVLFDDSIHETGIKFNNTGFDWDTAYTEDQDNSATAYVKGAVGSDGRIYIFDFDFAWVEFPDTVKWMLSIAGPHFIEQKASGKSIAQTLKRMQVFAREVPVKGGDKVARTNIVTPLVESGRVRIHKNIINRLLEDPRQGILKFKSSDDPGTDVNDTFVQALNRLRSFVLEEPKQIQHTSWYKTKEMLLNAGEHDGDWRDAGYF